MRVLLLRFLRLAAHRPQRRAVLHRAELFGELVTEAPIVGKVVEVLCLEVAPQAVLISPLQAGVLQHGADAEPLHGGVDDKQLQVPDLLVRVHLLDRQQVLRAVDERTRTGGERSKGTAALAYLGSDGERIPARLDPRGHTDETAVGAPRPQHIAGVAEHRYIGPAEQRQPTGTLHGSRAQELEERVVVERPSSHDAGIVEVVARRAKLVDLDTRDGHASNLS
jgi:hypothetical protein